MRLCLHAARSAEAQSDAREATAEQGARGRVGHGEPRHCRHRRDREQISDAISPSRPSTVRPPHRALVATMAMAFQGSLLIFEDDGVRLGEKPREVHGGVQVEHLEP